MLVVLFELDLLGEFIEMSVNDHAHVSAALRLLEYLHMLTLTASDHGCEQLELRSGLELHDLIHHLVNGLSLDLPAAVRAVRDAYPRVKKSEIIVDLGHGAHCRARVPVRRLLVNGNGGRKSFYRLHIGLFHHAEELPRV